MNCQSCNTTVDYRFLTNCPNCETKQPVIAPIQDLVASEIRLSWTRRLVNLIYIFVSSLAGMISGAVVVYNGCAITCMAFLSSTGNASHDCARGTAIGILSIWVGAFLGTVGGSVFAVKKPLCKSSH